jgi:hypothetical protein
LEKTIIVAWGLEGRGTESYYLMGVEFYQMKRFREIEVEMVTKHSEYILTPLNCTVKMGGLVNFMCVF